MWHLVGVIGGELGTVVVAVWMTVASIEAHQPTQFVSLNPIENLLNMMTKYALESAKVTHEMVMKVTSGVWHVLVDIIRPIRQEVTMRFQVTRNMAIVGIGSNGTS